MSCLCWDFAWTVGTVTAGHQSSCELPLVPVTALDWSESTEQTERLLRIQCSEAWPVMYWLPTPVKTSAFPMHLLVR